jgi:glycyl-tRNA synthetase
LKQDKTVTVRERDSTVQVRMPVADVPNVIRELSVGRMAWEEDVLKKYPKFVQQGRGSQIRDLVKCWREI